MTGVNAVGGNASNSGSSTAISESEKVSIMNGEFEKAEVILGDADLPAELKTMILDAIQEAKKSPSKSAVGKVVDGLKVAKSILDTTTGLIKTGVTLAPVIITLGHLFGLG